MSLVTFPRVAAARAESLPRAPQSIDETELPQTFLVELMAKAMFQLGLSRLTEIGAHLCLSAAVVEALALFMRREGVLEVARRGATDADVHYDLTNQGRERTLEWLARNQYFGPAPVPLDRYRERVEAQSVAKLRVTRDRVEAAFDGEVVSPRLRDLLGTALNSGRPILLFGQPGSGKTWLAEHLHRLIQGPIAVPHAILVDGEVVRVHDPHWHYPVAEAAQPLHSPLDNRARPDTRWVLCERPLVSSGGELTMEMLDLSFDARSGYYEAPPHFRANNGLFIVDDLGRQVVTVRQLLNRWIVPMERRVDHLMLRSGSKFSIPFDLVLVFSSNLGPDELEDAAFLRRLGHKIHVGPVTPTEFRTLFERACKRLGLVPHLDECLITLAYLYTREQRPRLASHPQEFAHLVASRCAYLQIPTVVDPPAIEWAWQAYFATPDPLLGTHEATAGASTTSTGGRP
jgi:predicted ATPase with chaperone activity